MERYKNIDKVHFYKLPHYIDFKKIISVKRAQASTVPVSIRNAIGGIFYFFQYSLIKERAYEFVSSDNGRFLFLYGLYNYRNDHQKTFLDFCKRFPDADVLYAKQLAKKEYTLCRFFSSVPMFFVWLLQMLMCRVDLLSALNAIPYVLLCYYQMHYTKSLLKKDYKFIVSYYDASPDECFTIQEFKNKGITTMTLQHGIFAKKNVVRSITDTAFEIEDSVSEYYLAWNQYTKDEAMRLGKCKDKVVVLGAPKYINYEEPLTSTCSNENIFGVILNNSAFETHNMKLIETANEIARTTDMKYVLRYHPQMNGDEYQKMYGPGFLCVNNNKTSIKEYASSVSFTIISSSSVFVDLLLLKHPTYRLKVFDEDTYSTVPFNSFEKVEDLKILLQSNQIDKNAFKYLCNSYNTFKNYRDFFDSFL